MRLPSRLRWNDLSIRAKIGVILVVILIVTALATLATSAFVSAAGRQTREGIATTIEIRTLAQDVQLKIETLQRLHERLSTEYTESGFDPATTTIDDLYFETYDDIVENDVPRLRQLTLSLADPEDVDDVQVQFRTLLGNLEDGRGHFEGLMRVVTSLTAAETGSQVLLDQQGDALEASVSQLGTPTLTSQMDVIRGIEESMILTGSNQRRQDLDEALIDFGIIHREFLGDPSAELQGGLVEYQNTAAAVGSLLLQFESARSNGIRDLGFARDSASKIGNIADDFATEQAADIEDLTNAAQQPLLIGALVQLLALAALMFLFGRAIVGSVNRLLTTTRRFEEGNFNARAEITGEDEFNQLGRSFNSMAQQLSDLVGGLEARVAERTRDLSITAEIGQAVLAASDPRELMQEVVDLIRDRFDFYHVQVFVVNDERTHARLVASTGVVGRELLSRRHQLAIGSQSIIGQVTANGASQIALDTDTSAVHRRNELLPDTRSEMALPMRIGERVIGALDVQSVAPNAFDTDTVAVFQIMADQLAIALENARVRRDLDTAMQELETMEHRITSEAWRTYQRTRDPNAPLGFEMQGEVLLPQRGGIPTPVQEAMSGGRLVARPSLADGRSGGSDVNTDSGIQIALPIKVRGEVIGAFGFGGEALNDLSDDDIALVEAVIDRVGLALENMRLVEQTARRAEYEQIVNEITAKIVGSTDVNFILQTTVRELGRALRAPQTSVQLRRESQELLSDDQ